MNRRRFITTTAAAGLGAGLFPDALRAADPIRIGVLLPFSKAFAVLGENTFAGFMLGAKEAGPTIAGRPYTIVKEDDTADPSAEQGCSRYHFRVSNSAWQSAAPLGPWAKAKLGDRAYICVFNFAFGQQSAAHFKKAFTEAGGTVVGESFPPFNTTNYAPYFPAIKDAKPQFVFANFAGADAVAFIKQYADFGLKGPIKVIGPSNLVSEDVLSAEGDAALGVYSNSYYTPSYDIPKNRAFVKACKDAGKEADHFLCAGYDVAQALFGALRETKGDVANKERLIQIITDMRIDSPRGPLRFDPKNHNPISDVHLRTVQAGPLRHVVVDVLKDVRHPDMGCVL